MALIRGRNIHFTKLSRIIIASVAGSLSPYSLANAKPVTTTAQHIIVLERRYSHSFVTGDASVAQRLLTDDFRGFGPNGRSWNKAKMLSMVRAVPHQGSARIISIDVRLYGDTAIASGLEADTDVGSPVVSYRRWLDTWRQFRSGWRMVASAEIATAP